MEALLIFITKSSGLIVMFYCAYYFLLRKETFFNSNRWFLLTGLITSVLLPFLVYTKNIWVDPEPSANLDFSKFVINQPIVEQSFEINWNYILLAVYSIGFLIFIIKFVLDFYSLTAILKGKKVQQQADFKFIDTFENIAPFSYFDYIVYNSSMYTESELESIIEHEKVHSEQNHTIDVLISRFFCILFWFNPIVWLYKKAITQNLEFIADKEAAQKITDKRAYQYTLLKITTHENCVAITNHFYQSLIKKRIIMLNQNQSKKRKSWKFCVIVPALVAFVLLFQVEVVAHEKPTIETSKNDPKSVDVYKITKATTDQELKENTKNLKENYDITATFSELERNSKKELIAIKVELKKGNEIAQKMQLKGSDAIKTFGIIISKLEDGKIIADFKTEALGYIVKSKDVQDLNNPALQEERTIFIDGTKATEEELAKLDPEEIESMDVIKNSGKSTLKIITKPFTETIKNSNKEIFIDGVKSDEKQLSKLNQKTISSVDVNTNENTVRITTKVNIDPKPLIVINGAIASPDFNMDDIDQKKISDMIVLKGKSAEDKYGPAGKNGVIEIITKVIIGKNESVALQGKVVQGFPTVQSNNTAKKQTEASGITTTTTLTNKTTLKTIGSGKQLVIVDGKIIKDKNFEFSSLDIEQMEVLKGIEAVTKYGNKGKDGVIVITTRK